MKRAPLRLGLVLAVVFFAGILKATLPPITIGNWTSTTILTQPRSGAATVLMNDGRILFTGGDSGGTAEFFNADGSVSSAGTMTLARSQHFAVVMSDGRVLVGGGNSGGGTTNSAEIYDPSAGTWTATGTMTSPRANATAALLQDGRVAIAGGDNAGAPNNTIEVFDSSSGSFSVVPGNMSASRTKQAMAVLQNGQVLVIGGFDGTNPLASTDICDPVAGTIVPGPPLTTARYSATATTLLNGQVAVIGGAGSDGNGGTTDLASIEIFDPTAGAFSTASAVLTTAREAHQAFLLPNNNNVLIAGGTSGGTSLASAELFSATASPTDGSWSYAVSATGAMTTARAGASGAVNQQNGPTSKVTPIPGLVIVGGGTDASTTTLASTEAYGYPTIQTDQSDYSPGTTVNISGSGFKPNETITITLVESPLFDTHGPYQVTADGNGNFTDASFTTDIHDENVRFFMSATGSQSGFVAQNTFTDSAPNKVSVGTQSPASISPAASANYGVGVTFNGDPSKPCTANLSVTAGLPTGATFLFNPASVASNGTTSSTLTISTTSSTPPGSFTFTVQASGTAPNCSGDNASNTGTLVVVENTATTLTSSQNPTVFGQSTTLKATVTQTAGTTTPTGGTVTFLDGTTTIGTATLSNGTATLPIATLSTGSHSLTASYAGVANTFGGSTSSAITQTINQASTTTAVASSANPSNFGQSVTFTATVAAVSPGAGNPTGTVTFTDGVNTLGTGTLSTTGGVTTATFTTSALAVGSHTINASYAGDTNFTASATTTALTQTVSTASTTTTLASSANPAVAGQLITFTATVTPSGGGTPTGSVAFKNGPITFATGTLSTNGGVTTATASAIISVGSASITAVYAGDSNFSGSTSSVLTQTVNKANTTTSLGSSSNPSVFDQAVTFTVTVAPVSPGAGAPSGTVTLTMGNAVEGTGTLSTSGGVTSANIVVSTLPVGANGLKASYPGDSNFNASATQGAFSQTVNAAPTTTTLTSSVNPSVFGQSVTFTATVTVNAPSTGTIPAAETVTFKDNGTTIGTGTTNASGMATFTTSSLSAATHPITATYAGDTDFATSTSTVSQVVNPAPTATALTSVTNPSIFGQSVTFTATVTVSSPGVGTIPAGDTVTFKDGSNTLGTGLTNASGVATFITSALTVATHSVTAVYTGDTSFATSTSNTVAQVVNQANTTTTVASSLNPSASGQSVTFTATVAAVAPGSGNPTGTVTFKDGSNTLGSGTLSTTAGVTTATFSTSTLTGGSHSITAVYGSDTNFSGSTSSALTQTVVAPPSISKAFGAATIPLNATTSLTFTITNPASNTVALTGLAFTDSLPAGLVVATPSGLVDNCGGTAAATAGSGSVSLAGGSVNANSSCSVIVNVTGTTAGQKNNITGAVSSTNGGTGNTAPASITVYAPPSITKVFGAAQINLNTSTSLAFTISNSNSNSLTGVAFTDVLPAGLVVATPNGLSTTCGGTTTAVAASGSIGLSGGTVAGSGSCTISVSVTATTTGMKNNTTGAVTSNEGGAGNTASASINVVGTPPTITSGNSTTFVAGMANAFTVTTNATPTASLSFTGTLPGAVSFTDNGNGSATIGYNGTAITAGNYPIVIKATNGVPPDASQNFTVFVVAGAPASITAFSGSGQSTTVGMAFGSPLVAKVQDAFNNPVAATTVMFAAPTNGPSGTFIGSSTATTDANGLASASFAANTAAGSYAVTASVSGVPTPTSFLLTNLAGPTTTLAIMPASATITAGQSQQYTAEGADQFNNPTGDLTAQTIFTISPDGSCSPVGADPASCTTNVADVNGSSHTVTGTYTNGAKGVASLTVTAGAFSQLQLLVPGETAAPGTTTGKTGTPNIEYVNGPFDAIVNAADQYFNVVSSVTDTVHIASNDSKATLLADAELVNGTGTLSVTLESVSYNPSTTTITASDVTNNSITSDTSPAIEVIVVYTAGITPAMAGTGDATAYTLTVNNAAAPNANNLESVQVPVPTADQGSIMNVSVIASNGGPVLNWNYDATKLPGTLRFFANSDSDAVTPGGTITITFTATSNAAVTTTPIAEQWITNGFSDAASNNGLPLAGPEPTVQVGAPPKITSGNTATFTYETPGTSFTVTTTGVPTPTVSESGPLAPGLNFSPTTGGATISGTPTAAGNYPITITAHSGFGSDATQMFTIVVNKADSVSTVMSSSEPSVFGQTVTFTATVSAVAPATGTPTGTVTFYADGTTQIGTAQTLNNYGKASVSTSTLSVGSHSITAVYNGDTNFNKTGDGASTAVVFTQDVNPASTTTAVTSSQNPSTFGQSVTFTATVSVVSPGSGTPTGSVQFVIDGTPSGPPITLNSSGLATLTTSALTVSGSPHTVTANYVNSDGNYKNSYGSLAGGQTVTPANTATSVSSSQNPSTFGQAVTFTAIVSNASGTGVTPTGSVQFVIDGANLGSPVALDASGHATSAPISTLSVSGSPHSVAAIYVNADGNFKNSNGTLTGGQTVNPANTATSVSSSQNPSTFGRAVTFTATVTNGSGTGVTPTGSVQFVIDGANFGSPVALDASGAATSGPISTLSVSGSPHAVKANYVNADGNFRNSYGSLTGGQTVNPANTTTTVSTSQTPSTFGQSVIFTATVTNFSGTGVTPTGSVQFVIDGNPFGGSVSLSASGMATISTANLAVNGSPHTVTANYANADGNFKNSNGTLTGGQTVNPAMTSTSVMSSANSSTFGQSVTFAATVTNASNTGVIPTGAVQFAVDGTNLGSPVALTATGTATSMATTTIPVSGSPHSVTAAFVNGDGNFSSSNGSLTSGQTVTAAPTMTTVSSSLNPSVYGQSVTFSATVTNATPGGASTATPTGSVQFVVDGANLGTPVMLTGGSATSMATSLLDVPHSPHTITTNYLNYDKDFQNSIGALSGGQNVTPAQLTITAASAAMVYGGAVPPITPSYSGFVNGEGASNLTPPPSCGTTAMSLSPVSGNPYMSTCSGAMDPNYTISYIPGIVTVTQASTTVTVTASPNPATFMQLVTITATITPQFSGVPTGQVTFYNNGTSIGTATLSNSCGTPPCPVEAVLPITTLPDSTTDNLTATYAGDVNFTGSTTATAFAETVQPAPVVSLNPMFVSFGNQNVNTSSKLAPVVLKNIGDANLNISSTNGISITGSNYNEFSETNNCGSTVAPNGTCTIYIVFSPADTGVATATLQVTDNDDDSAGSQQTVALTGAGLSTISGGSLYADAIFAAANACGSLSLSGGSTVDSFSSTQGYSASHQLNGGNVGTNGNVTLNGKNSEIFGTAAVDSTTSGACTSSSISGLTANGGATVLGGLEPLNGPIMFSNPAGLSSAPPTTTWNITSCPSGMTGCSNAGTKTVSLAPGIYGNVTISGGTTAHFSTGTYNFNSLTLSGKSILYVDSGPVVVNLAGASLSGGSPVMDVTGGSIENPSGVPANLQFNYAGSRGINLTGGSGSYATVYAPKALVNMSGGTDFFGSIIGGTVTSSGGTAVHYDTALPDIKAGNYIWFTAIANNVTGLPSNQQVKLYLTNSTINFTAGGTPYAVQVPNAVVTFNSSALGSQTTATSSYDLVNSRWSTAVSAKGLTGNTFVVGVAFPVPVDFPTGIQNVTWSAAFSTDTPGVDLQWQWGAAVYSNFSTTYATGTTSPANNSLGVNPEDGSADSNGTDPAGTPEAYKSNVTFGATGGGLNNYVGFLSPGAMVIPTIAPMSVSPSSLDFGGVSQGSSSSPLTAVLANNDSATHNLNNITIMGADMGDFALVPNSASTPNNCLALTSLPSGGNCTLYVSFTPTDIGTRTAKVVINDDANNSPQTVYLTGTGQ